MTIFSGEGPQLSTIQQYRQIPFAVTTNVALCNTGFAFDFMLVYTLTRIKKYTHLHGLRNRAQRRLQSSLCILHVFDAIANMSRNSMLKFVISEHPSIEQSCLYIYVHVHVYGISKFCTPQTVLSLAKNLIPTPWIMRVLLEWNETCIQELIWNLQLKKNIPVSDVAHGPSEGWVVDCYFSPLIS